jgi:hypothetical protein
MSDNISKLYLDVLYLNFQKNNHVINPDIWHLIIFPSYSFLASSNSVHSGFGIQITIWLGDTPPGISMKFEDAIWKYKH